MKHHFSSSHQHGFTLIELIVVIAILAVLASISAPILMSVQDNARRTASKKVCTDIVEGVTRYMSDNNNLMPYDPEEATADAKYQIFLETSDGKDAKLLSILTARDDHQFNTTGDIYLRADLQERAADGLYEKDGQLGLYDPWGHPYYVILCEEESGCIDPFTKKQLRGKQSLAYGLGPDGEGAAKAPTHKKAAKGAKGNKKHQGGKKGSSKEAKAAAAAAAEEEAEALEDNVYSWKQ